MVCLNLATQKHITRTCKVTLNYILHQVFGIIKNPIIKKKKVISRGNFLAVHLSLPSSDKDIITRGKNRLNSLHKRIAPRLLIHVPKFLDQRIWVELLLGTEAKMSAWVMNQSIFVWKLLIGTDFPFRRHIFIGFPFKKNFLVIF